MSEVVEVDVLEWYGQAPDRKEIKSSIEAAHKQGWVLKEKEYRVGTHYPPKEKSDEFEPEEHHVVILFYEEAPNQRAQQP